MTTATIPTFDVIPASLAGRAQWVLWRYEPVTDKDKPTKVPYCPTGERADTTDPSTWLSFAAARAVAEIPDSPCDGIGYVLTADDGLVGVDLDGVVDAAGHIHPDAAAIVARLASYTEVSPSGRGLRIFCRGVKPGPRCKTTTTAGHTVEMYDRARFLTVTGGHVPGTPATIEERTDALAAVYAEWFPAPSKPATSGPKSGALSDEEILRRRRTDGAREKFTRLYDQGDRSDYPSPSEADMALMGLLHFYTQDEDQLCHLFRGSQLYRSEKGDDYVRRTAHAAIEGGGDTFTGRRERRAPGTLNVITLSSVAPQEIEWLWPGRIPFGMLTLIGGVPGVGKSFITNDTAARVTREFPWPDATAGAGTAPRGDVIFLAAEDALAQTVRPRLNALGADCDRVHYVRATENGDGESRMFSLADDLPALRAVLSRTGARLVVIDPLNGYLGGKTDNYSDPEVRRLLTPLAQLAEELRIAVVSIMHLKKGAEDTVIYRVGGSVAFAAIMRSILFVSQDHDQPEHTDTRIFLTQPKTNIGRRAPTLAARITPQLTIEWEAKPVTLTAEEAMAPRRGGGALSTAVRWLTDQLDAGPQLGRDVEAAALAAGISESTLRRGRERLRVVVSPVRDPASPYKLIAAWRWALPEPDAQQTPHPES
ncbi:MAG: AAA family ATPase [Candidatus Rokuibacteriota bacterium]